MNAATIKLHMTHGALSGKEYVFEGLAHCVIGRAHDCDIRLPIEPGQLEASRHHCMLIIEPPSIRIRDLGSLNGTYVNGRKIGQRLPSQSPDNSDPGPAADQELHDGDEIQVGHNVLRVETTAVAEEALQILEPAYVV